MHLQTTNAHFISQRINVWFEREDDAQAAIEALKKAARAGLGIKVIAACQLDPAVRDRLMPDGSTFGKSAYALVEVANLQASHLLTKILELA